MDIDTIQQMLIKIAVFAPITTGLVQAIKMTEILPDRFLPLASLAVGAIFGWFFIAGSAIGILGGLALGLAAIGIFEFGKTTLAGK